MKRTLTLLLALLCCASAFAQQRDTLMGQIVGANEKGRKNVRVSLASDPSKVKFTDKKGYFRFTDISLDDTLNFVIKRQTYSIPIAGRRGIKIHAIQGETVTKEDLALVNMGYGYIDKRNRLSPGVTITGDELRAAGYTSIYDALRIYVPGLSVDHADISGGAATVGSMRGQNSITGDQSPLYLVDGIIVDDIAYVSINDVVSVEIMKDASIYGSRGANGAILVTTVLGGSEASTSPGI